MPVVMLPPATGCGCCCCCSCCCACGISACAVEVVRTPPTPPPPRGAFSKLDAAVDNGVGAISDAAEMVDAPGVGVAAVPITVSESTILSVAADCVVGGNIATACVCVSVEDAAGIVGALIGGVTGDVIAIAPVANVELSVGVGVVARLFCADGTGDEVGVGGSSGNCKESSSREQELPCA